MLIVSVCVSFLKSENVLRTQPALEGVSGFSSNENDLPVFTDVINTSRQRDKNLRLSSTSSSAGVDLTPNFSSSSDLSVKSVGAGEGDARSPSNRDEAVIISVSLSVALIQLYWLLWTSNRICRKFVLRGNASLWGTKSRSDFCFTRPLIIIYRWNPVKKNKVKRFICSDTF